MKLFEICSVVFSFKEKRFLCKSLYFCVAVLSLYLLKFIDSYVEFFPSVYIETVKKDF